MNTNPNAKRVLIFGDSNTWGSNPDSPSRERYSADERYTGIVQNLLGEGFEIIEEGLGGRTIATEDPRPGKVGRNGSEYLLPCLHSHEPLNLIVVMLGTNDLKHGYGISIDEIVQNMRTYIIEPALTFAPVLLVAPPPMDDQNPQTAEKWQGGTLRVKELEQAYEKLASSVGCDFFSAHALTKPGSDGVHLSRESHEALGEALAAHIQRNIM